MGIEAKEILTVVAVQLGRRRVEGTDRLREDLGAESADLVNLVAALEDRFGIDVSDDELDGLQTVDELQQLVERLAGD